MSPAGAVTVIDASWVGSYAVNLTYEDDSGGVHREIVYRSNESPRLGDLPCACRAT
ncbi:MAG: hypothetical protein OXF75_05125 [Acidimicrobiaceae bacterium]|nr:hypothetical protein [Acidimicrobiaceae bacterium]